jgi:hypothetical protein
MSLIAKIAGRVVSTVSSDIQPMLISENPNLISPGPNLISPAPGYLSALPLMQLFIGVAFAAGIIAALWRYNKSKVRL